ncbi:metal ABC transporter substrate-binding protein [Actinomycetaceae bacterium MB13-C1-2]|nr:metal ABC transporter substrate-binding protein [Actinomycetaceae bacterium MB13-C1-2]
MNSVRNNAIVASGKAWKVSAPAAESNVGGSIVTRSGSSFGRGVRRALALAGGSIATLAMVAGCSSGTSSQLGGDAEQSITPEAEGDRPVVVVSSYPLAFLASSVAGDDAVVEDMSANAGDAHHLELSPSQVNEISKANLALYIGEGFQPAMEQAISVAGIEGMDVLSAIPNAEVIAGDPHVWLDPMISADIADAIAEKLSEENPAAADTYRQNAETLRKALEEQDGEYRTVLANCDGETLLTSHEAFGYLAARYGLEQVGVLGVDPDAEPSPARINEVLALIQDRGITTLFVEPTTAHSHGAAEPDHENGNESVGESVHEEEDHDHIHLTEEQTTAISQALGIPALLLDPMEVQVDPEHDFLTVMHMNLHALADGLSCAVSVH